MFLLKVIILFSLNYNTESTVTLIENIKKKRHSCMPATSQEGNEEWGRPVSTTRPVLHNRPGTTRGDPLKNNPMRSPQGRRGNA